MFAPSRDDARRLFFESWKKYRLGQTLTGLEKIALQVMMLHPEYHALLEEPERYLHRDYFPETGDINPFLHLSLHLAVEEQLSIGQPTGILGLYERILRNAGSDHEAKHAVIECLGEVIWRAQRYTSAPDEKTYLECLERRAEKP
jgi:uncharacterized protein DUF1841